MNSSGPAPTSLEIYERDMNAFETPSGKAQDKILEDYEKKRINRKEMEKRLVLNSLRYAYGVAMEYTSDPEIQVDLISEANQGLVFAASRFDETRGLRFITYAIWWIRQHINQWLIRQGRQVRVPMNQYELAGKVHRTSSVMSQSLGRQPTRSEIADKLELPEVKVTDAMVAFQTAYSLDHPPQTHKGRESGRVLGEIMGHYPEDELALMDTTRRILSHMDGLKERSRIVLCRYYGVGPDAVTQEGETLEEIADSFGLTRERVRQIKERAINDLRRTIRLSRFSPLMEDRRRGR